jgi:hypothetical protein
MLKGVDGSSLLWGWIVAYRNLEIDHLLGESRHLVVETEGVLSNTLGSEDEVTLAFLCPIQDDLAARCGDGVVDIEGSAGLDLQRIILAAGSLIHAYSIEMKVRD